MNKKLKFDPKLVPLVLNKSKTSTWRLWDDKNLSTNDIVDFLDSQSGEHFATAKLTEVIEKPLKELTIEDKRGHETFNSDQEMYDTYHHYYGKPVNGETLIKIIRFKLSS